MKIEAGITLPATRPPLTEEDWNFSSDRVPDKELVPCLLWEFLRESQTARQLTRDWIELLTAPDAPSRDQAPLVERMRALWFRLNHKLNMFDFIYRAAGPLWGMKKLANVPWQKLAAGTKHFLAEPCDVVNKPVFIGVEPFASMLAEAARKHLNDVEDKLVSGDVLPYLPAREMLFFSPPGSVYEALCVVVDWGRYDDNTIREGFEKLAQEIIKSRPKGITPQVHKASGLGRSTGEKSEWRGKLRDLGRTRLYCSYGGVLHLERANPSAYKWLVSNVGQGEGRRAVTKSLSDAKHRFVKAFQHILPFEKGQNPLCIGASRLRK